MSISHCMHHARRIAQLPETQWRAELAKLPDSCGHADCGTPHSCRKRNTDYLVMQFKIRHANEEKKDAA